MIDSDIQRISSTPNAPVVQLPERKHPGVVIQGDSLANLCQLASSAEQELAHGNRQEAIDVMHEVRTILEAYLESYTQAVSHANRQ